MKITTDFLRDEVRSGFYIPTAIKQAWAAQLLVLSEIDRICQKYNITYFADWGTLLGTVRHGGYIPWDDDLDICMKREDYIRFRQVADEELSEEFAIHDYERKEDHWLFLSRVVNRNHICFEEDHLNKYYNFPYIATVDIFILDYLYKDETQERKRCDEVKYLIALADKIVAGGLTPQGKESELSKIEALYHTKIDRNLDDRRIGVRLYQLAELQMARVTEQESDRIGQIFPWIIKGGKGLPKRYYQNVVRLPFEMTTMPVPECYHLVLRNRYGDYFKIHKVWNGHDYPYFEGQRKNLQAVADFELPEFSYNPEIVRKGNTELNPSGSLKSISKECIEELSKMLDMLAGTIEKDAFEDVLTFLPECQQFVVDYGTLVESVKGEENLCTKLVVSELEHFCDALFAIYETLTSVNGVDCDLLAKQVMALQQAFTKVKQIVWDQIIEKKEILFVTTGAKQWKGFESLYREMVADTENDVYVVPVPVMPKNALGQVLLSNEEILDAVKMKEYPKGLKMTSWTVFSLELHHPDIIFIQEPYDGENPCLTIPPQFYAENLQKYTGKLVYIPVDAVEEFGEADTTALYNMKHYVTAPGVVYADIIIVQSESMKQHYIKKLTTFAGLDTEELWDEKILPLGLPVLETRKLIDADRKRLLFCVGCNEVFETEDDFVTRLQEKLSVIEKYQENLQVGLCMYPGDQETWNLVVGREVTRKVVELMDTYSINTWCDFYDLDKVNIVQIAENFDMYYGSATPFVHLFHNEKKPVMLAGFDI